MLSDSEARPELGVRFWEKRVAEVGWFDAFGVSPDSAMIGHTTDRTHGHQDGFFVRDNGHSSF